MTDHAIFGNAISTTLTSDPATCVGCAGFSSRARCQFILESGACQKKLHHETQRIDQIRHILVAGMVHHNEKAAGDAVRLLVRLAE